MEKILRTIERFIPKSIYKALQPAYHFFLSFLGALFYKYPSKELVVIGVTGTKGKSTTSQMVFEILSEAKLKTALISTIEFRIGDESEPNLFKMTTPGRFFLQRFLRKAIKNGATHAVIEISSEAVLQHRHRFLYLDALIVTNLSPEHLERHGSYENYRSAKVEIAKRVLNSKKPRQILILNGDNSEMKYFADVQIKDTRYFSLAEAKPYEATAEGSSFTWRGSLVKTNLPGEFNIMNALSALSLSEALSIPKEIGIKAIENFSGAKGRVERIDVGQNFRVIVDYAHTPDSLQKLYEAFPGRKICVLGGTGGGRDSWKRPVMGQIASRMCDEIILTNEDPYDEDPEKIIKDIKEGVTNPKTAVIIDRREAIRTAIKHASQNTTILISGKGTDPFIMGPHGTKVPWSDAKVAEEELKNILEKKPTKD